MRNPEGTIKMLATDFVVDEIPAYAPSGQGSHLYVHFEKIQRTTDDVVRAIAGAIGVDRREVGVAGLKDKVAVTTQWISVPAKEGSNDVEERVGSLAITGVRVLETQRHGNKLKTGHLRGNRFRIVVRGTPPALVAEVIASFERIASTGVPNAFGAQRFGRDGDTHERARAWLTGRERAPGDPRLRRFHFSALQSAIFNAVLEERIRLGSWNIPVAGDLLKKEETGGMFVCTDVQLDRERAARGELCPTGPIVGDRMRQPEHEALELEQRIVGPLIRDIDLRRARSLGEGTRRPLVLRVADVSCRAGYVSSTGFQGSSVDEATSSGNAAKERAIEVRFVLPKGAYATTVLENALAITDASTSRGYENDERDQDGTEEE